MDCAVCKVIFLEIVQQQTHLYLCYLCNATYKQLCGESEIDIALRQVLNEDDCIFCCLRYIKATSKNGQSENVCERCNEVQQSFR